jgi:hypothetical protein
VPLLRADVPERIGAVRHEPVARRPPHDLHLLGLSGIRPEARPVTPATNPPAGVTGPKAAETDGNRESLPEQGDASRVSASGVKPRQSISRPRGDTGGHSNRLPHCRRPADRRNVPRSPILHPSDAPAPRNHVFRARPGGVAIPRPGILRPRFATQGPVGLTPPFQPAPNARDIVCTLRKHTNQTPNKPNN